MTDGSQEPKQRVVAVYGSAGIQPGSTDWHSAYALGRALAEAGYVLLSGGYSGVMEAASRGAAEAGGRVVGVEVGLFRDRGLRVNRWVQDVVTFETLRDRLYFMVEEPDAFVAVRGGVGALSGSRWCGACCKWARYRRRPFVLVGPMWRRLVATLCQRRGDGAARLDHDAGRCAGGRGARAGGVVGNAARCAAAPGGRRSRMRGRTTVRRTQGRR